MYFINGILFVIILIVSVTAKKKPENPKPNETRILAGYAPGVSGMPPIDYVDCLNDEILDNHRLSNALECARTCKVDEPPKTCYYSFTIERYPVNGQACQLCTPNVTNSVCANCQCITGDGVQRMGLTVNRMIPGPTIQVCLGDYVVIDVKNTINEDGVTIHWHGIFQEGSQYYDGVPNLTQCPITFQNTFRYQFYAQNGGTHFWHAHTGLQKLDGVFGAFIIRQPEKYEPNADLYDFDLTNHVIVINDWMHEEATERFPGRTILPQQLPDTVLINGKGRYTDTNTNTTTNVTLDVITVDPNQRYRFRLINSFCTTCSAEITIQGHNLTVIESDGQPIKPVVVNSIITYTGERYDFVVNTNQTPGAYWIQVRALDECKALTVQQLALLQYVNASTTPSIEEPTYDNGLSAGVALDPSVGDCNGTVPNSICVNSLRHALPVDPRILKPKPDYKVFLNIRLLNYDLDDIFQPNTYNKFLVPLSNLTVTEMVGNISFEFPPSPPLSQWRDLPKDQFCNSENLPAGCNETCTCTHMLEFPLNSVVEIIMVDEFSAPDVHHPFHLHGYAFHVLSMGQPLGPIGNATGTISVDYVKQLDKAGKIKRNFISPPAKDSLAIPNNGYAVIRFRASNPGYWLYHCHVVYHQMVGMEVVFNVGKRRHLPRVPKDFPTCGNFKPKIPKIKKKIQTQTNEQDLDAPEEQVVE